MFIPKAAPRQSAKSELRELFNRWYSVMWSHTRKTMTYNDWIWRDREAEQQAKNKERRYSQGVACSIAGKTLPMKTWSK